MGSSHIKRREVKCPQSKTVKRLISNKALSFTPVMPRPKACTIGEMPKLYTCQRMQRKEKKVASLFPSFVKEKFKLPESNFRVEYYFKKHRWHAKSLPGESKSDLT